MKSYRFSIMLIVIQQFLFALDTTSIHQLGSAISLTQIGFLRGVGGMTLALYLAPRVGWVFYTCHPYLQAARALFTVGYTWVLIFSFTFIPLADATAISYVSGLYVVLLAGPLLGEVVKGHRYAAVIVGIAGSMMISKPGISSLSWVYFALLVGSVLNSMAVILTKLLRHRDNAATILFYVSLAQLLIFASGAAETWHIALTLWPWIVAVIVTGPLGMYCGIIALKHADASALAPYSYIRLIFTIFISTFVFNEWPDFLSIVGSCIIILSCWYVMKRASSEKATGIGWLSRGAWRFQPICQRKRRVPSQERTRAPLYKGNTERCRRRRRFGGLGIIVDGGMPGRGLCRRKPRLYEVFLCRFRD